MRLSFSLVKNNLSPARFHLHESVHLIREIGLIGWDLQYVGIHYGCERGNDQSLVTSIESVLLVVAEFSCSCGFYPRIDYCVGILFGYRFSHSGSVSDNEQVRILLFVFFRVCQLSSVGRIDYFSGLLYLPVFEVYQNQSARIRKLSKVEPQYPGIRIVVLAWR